jgi:transcription elongation factor Elf1
MRPVKLEFFDHAFTCPLCSADIVFTSMQRQIISSLRKCPSCKKHILIANGKAVRVKAEAMIKKPPKKDRV